VSTYVLMRILESAPQRYDQGMRLLTLGRVERAYDRLARRIGPGQRVLDLGCGTGALSIRAARRGASVTGLDINPEMLVIAQQRIQDAGVQPAVTLQERGVAELDGERSESVDVITAGLFFSELGDDELRYTLAQVARILKTGGLLLAADEVLPDTFPGRALHALLKAPLAALAYLVTQQTTHAVRHLPERVEEAGLTVESLVSSNLGGFAELRARKPEGVT